ncbi:(2Fe-2S)-binding protein [Novosphingobium endophyticum]|uniref:(2Fe-2S)-binding protein n=1 Tax=Novosphingobium endophyticum TaxID=1955250 RepID=A0A916TSL2_9SPHN|nr:aromatic ring-hydroxylating dioxygenase subunit alpha [Novosphingobium endophyticum]GGC01397.1 (2Fe-2S)-binding protein [Novosphingobium endophyticum]
MTLPKAEVVRAARRASSGMADRDTPFIFDEWYVAAFSDDVGRALLPRKLLGKNVLLYRTAGGEVVALDDRCAHRSYPLSDGTLEGDTVVCGYHGFRYDAKGDCIEVPAMAKCPRSIGVKRYALVERGPLLWVWMGNAEAADPALIPDTSYHTSPEWACSKEYLHLPGNYVSLHENLLDLTHLSYIHAKSFGSPEYARAPYTTELGYGRFTVRREVIPTVLPPVWADPMGLTGVTTAARIAVSAFESPGLHRVTTSFYDSAVPEGERVVGTICTSHIPTPETRTSTHYHIVHGRNFALDDTVATQVMHDRLFTAFREDVDALTKVEVVLEETAPEDFYEISVPTDGPSVAMRRYLLQRADAEAQARAES